MRTSDTVIYKSDSGHIIQFRINSMFKVSILQMEVNFNPYDHVDFAYLSLTSMPGVRILSGIQSTGKNKGQYSFLLSKNFDIESLKADIKQQFENYFIKF